LLNSTLHGELGGTDRYGLTGRIRVYPDDGGPSICLYFNNGLLVGIRNGNNSRITSNSDDSLVYGLIGTIKLGDNGSECYVKESTTDGYVSGDYC
jgi:hypothetical protein